MAKFFIGQRVRIVSCNEYDYADAMSLVGQEAIVNNLDVENERLVFGNIGVTVNGEEGWCFLPQELEPILPEGFAPSEFSFHELMDNLKEEQHEHY